jgi:hypothetical protein
MLRQHFQIELGRLGWGEPSVGFPSPGGVLAFIVYFVALMFAAGRLPVSDDSNGGLVFDPQLSVSRPTPTHGE